MLNKNGSVMIQGDKEDLQRKVVAIRDVGLMEEEENVLAGVPQRSNILMKQNVPPSANGHGNDTAAKIMWFADATLTGTEIVPIQKRFDDLEKDPINGTRNSAFSNGYKEQFGGTTLYEVQRKLGKEYITFFADKLNLNETDFYPWLKNKVHERIIMRKMPVLPTS